MRSSQRVQAFIKTKEKLSFKAYPDPKTKGAPYTCGWGSTRGVKADTVWNEQECEDAFLSDVATAEDEVEHYVPQSVPLTQGQFDALVSIFFNVGPGSSTRDGIGRLKNGQPSTLLRKLIAQDYEGAGQEFLKWVSPGTDVENGLRIRRSQELELFWKAPA